MRLLYTLAHRQSCADVDNILKCPMEKFSDLDFFACGFPWDVGSYSQASSSIGWDFGTWSEGVTL